VWDDGTHGPDQNIFNNTSTDTDALPHKPRVDLFLCKDDGVTTATPGQTLTYTVTAQNLGEAATTGVVITDALPSGVAFVSASGGGTFANGIVTWNVGTLATGATLTRTLVLTVNNPTPAGQTQISNTISIADDNTNGPDCNPANNTCTDTDT